MIKAVMTTEHAVVRVHDEFVRGDVEAMMPRLDQIVSASYRRRLARFPMDQKKTVR